MDKSLLSCFFDSQCTCSFLLGYTKIHYNYGVYFNSDTAQTTKIYGQLNNTIPDDLDFLNDVKSFLYCKFCKVNLTQVCDSFN